MNVHVKQLANSIESWYKWWGFMTYFCTLIKYTFTMSYKMFRSDEIAAGVIFATILMSLYGLLYYSRQIKLYSMILMTKKTWSENWLGIMNVWRDKKLWFEFAD